MMPPNQKALVRLSWEALVPKADGLALLFYHRLFATAPATRVLFANADPVAQRKKLIAALAAVVNGLDGLDSLSRVLGELGERHASYGVDDGRYDAWDRPSCGRLSKCLDATGRAT